MPVNSAPCLGPHLTGQHNTANSQGQVRGQLHRQDLAVWTPHYYTQACPLSKSSTQTGHQFPLQCRHLSNGLCPFTEMRPDTVLPIHSCQCFLRHQHTLQCNSISSGTEPSHHNVPNDTLWCSPPLKSGPTPSNQDTGYSSLFFQCWQGWMVGYTC